MDSNKVVLVSSGFVAGLIAGVIFMNIFSGSGGAPRETSAPAPVTPGQPQGGPDRLRLTQDIRQLEDILAKDPKNYQGWVQLGNNYFDIGEQQKSVDSYRRALALNDKDPNVWTDMGIMYRGLKQFPVAVDAFKKAMALDPRHPESRLNLGIVYVHDLQNFPEAIVAWDDFLRIERPGPRADQVREQLAQLKKMASGAPSGQAESDLDRAARELGKKLNPPAAK